MAKKRDKFEHNPGMGTLFTFLILFVVNYLTISVAANLFPDQIVLGTASITRTWALIHASVAISLFATFAAPLVLEWEHRKKKMLSNMDWMKVYLVINFLAVWKVGRFAEELGLGLTSWLVALGLAVALDFTQGAAMMSLKKWQKA